MAPSHEKKFLHSLLLTGAEYDTIKKIASAFGSYEAAWRAPDPLLRNAGISGERTDAIVEAHHHTNPDDEMRKLVSEQIAFITVDDPQYPQELHTIAAPPFALYIKGSFAADTPRLAVVGTRKATPYGREATRKIITDLAAETNVAIVSGLAQGIDTEAHRAALDCGLKTIGVLGSGSDRGSFFPPANWNLAEEIVARGGAVISEYPPGAPALKHHFPARNRIIAGLSLGTIVVEAPEKSGALITANFALEQGREIFAIPSQMFSPNAAGAHRLIQDGAKLVTNAADIIDELGIPRRTIAEKRDTLLTSDTEKTILGLLDEPMSVDEIKKQTRFQTPEIVSSLSELELKGCIRPMGQNRFQKIS